MGAVVDAVAAGRSGIWPFGCLAVLSLWSGLGFSARLVFPRVYFIWRVFSANHLVAISREVTYAGHVGGVSQWGSVDFAVCSGSSSVVCDGDHVGRGYIRLGGKCSGCHFVVSYTGGIRRVLVARARAALPGFCGRRPWTGSEAAGVGVACGCPAGRT